ncbi:hypothetical protein H2200_009305 [Cladophialophora chaetospira]|uniref:Uncharacterized protein n=1 Tax=Cladophialophora chaetospira TaxID=386627 RepID=A0AA38X3V1_9EURO|nr:hypothetical protein H2200_009305 [Cladophialophora chaetospira]
MSSGNSVAASMLNTYLHSDDGIIDRITQGDGRVLRNANRSTQPGSAAQKHGGKKDTAAIQKLEKEMDKMTDPVLLRDAKAYQQGHAV